MICKKEEELPETARVQQRPRTGQQKRGDPAQESPAGKASSVCVCLSASGGRDQQAHPDNAGGIFHGRCQTGQNPGPERVRGPAFLEDPDGQNQRGDERQNRRAVRQGEVGKTHQERRNREEEGGPRGRRPRKREPAGQEIKGPHREDAEQDRDETPLNEKGKRVGEKALPERTGRGDLARGPLEPVPGDVGREQCVKEQRRVFIPAGIQSVAAHAQRARDAAVFVRIHVRWNRKGPHAEQEGEQENETEGQPCAAASGSPLTRASHPGKTPPGRTRPSLWGRRGRSACGPGGSTTAWSRR